MMRTNIIQLVKFSLVGVSNTIIGYLIYIISLKILRYMGMLVGSDIYISWLLMFLLSVGWSFYWNNVFVFKSIHGDKKKIVKALIKTYISYAFSCLFIAEILLHIAVDILYISEYIAPAVILFITAPLNFLIQKLWVFKG